MKKFIVVGILSLTFSAFAKEPSAPKAADTPPSAKVFFANLKDGQTIPTEYKVQFGVEGMALKKAGENVNDKKSGHHHVIINKGPVAEGEIIPADSDHLHFGQAQTDAVLKLKPGTHSLTLQLADGAHRSFGEKLSSTVKVIVK